MNELIGHSGHLGWVSFAILVFTGLWWLLFDIVWRLKNAALSRLVAAMLAGWFAGVGLILLVAFLGNP